jgi:hypothetical protein
MRTPWCFLAVALALCSTEAAAQTAITEETHIASPQRFAFELRFGPYDPDVDEGMPSGSTACGSGPYNAVFNDETGLMTELEFDWQPLDIFVGSLGIAGSFGMFHVTNKAFEEGSCTRSNDETGLWVLPLNLLAVVRFDILAERWSVPIVPYFKAGLSYAIWVATDADGISTADDGSRGYGGSFGLRLAGGLMLLLDWIEPRAARTFDNEFGVNHSYIFFEYYWAWVDGFGSGNRMNVGDDSWVLGLALEF